MILRIRNCEKITAILSEEQVDYLIICLQFSEQILLFGRKWGKPRCPFESSIRRAFQILINEKNTVFENLKILCLKYSHVILVGSVANDICRLLEIAICAGIDGNKL